MTVSGKVPFNSDVDRAWYEHPDVKKQIVGKMQRKAAPLPKNLADASKGAASFHGVVLTADKNNGPMPTASSNGGNIIFLTDPLDGESLKEWVRKVAHQAAGADVPKALT